MDASELLSGARVVPVVVIDDAGSAVPLAETLVEAGLRVIEVTLRTGAAMEAIERIAARVPDMIVGAGSIRREEQLAEVQNAGARFAVSPGASAVLLGEAASLALPFVPGAQTPTEIIGLLERGYRLQKFFPAELAGGVPYLNAVSAPLPEARFMPTGGITAERAPSYLELRNVACVGGTWIAPAPLLAKGDYAAIGRLAADAARIGV